MTCYCLRHCSYTVNVILPHSNRVYAQGFCTSKSSLLGPNHSKLVFSPGKSKSAGLANACVDSRKSNEHSTSYVATMALLLSQNCVSRALVSLQRLYEQVQYVLPCNTCSGWYHCACAGTTHKKAGESDFVYTCTDCQ